MAKRRQRNSNIGPIPGFDYSQGGNAYYLSGINGAPNPVDPSTQLAQTYEEPAPAPVDDGGGGGGGLLAPEAPRPELASSPEWLTFLNALGLEQGQFSADIDRQRGVAQNLAAQQASDIEAQGPLERRQIAGGLETRGMARSGQFVRSLAEQRAQQGRRQGQVQSGLTNQLSGLESQLSNRLIDIGARRAQQELQMRAAGYV